VTGGSGLVGRAVVHALVSADRPVTALARSQYAAVTLERLGARIARGDVMDGEAIRAGMRGCASLFNIAGVNEFCARDVSQMFRINAEAPRRMVEAAAETGVGRVVHTSSAATLGEAAGTLGSESSPHRGHFLSQYERSKHEGELAAFEAGRRRGVEVVCVNPSSVQGPGRTSGTAKILILYLRGKMRFFVPTKLSLVDIDDSARGHLLAEERGIAGERYVLNGATLPIGDALDLISAVAGPLSRPRLLPGWAAMSAAGAVEAVALLRGARAPVCRETVRTLLHGHAYDGSRATRELGLVYTPIEETLERTVRWLRAEALVPPA
jgi:dihydroflavonol-4-reductase